MSRQPIDATVPRHVLDHPPVRCSIHCILPPHILEAIVTRTAAALSEGRIGSDPKKKAAATKRLSRAVATLGINNTFSHARLGYDESSRLTRQAARVQRLLGNGPAPLVQAITAGQPSRTIRTANNHNRPTGPVARAEGAPATGDKAVDEAYDYMGATYDFYWTVFNRNSIDDAGMPLNGTVHYGQDYDNAYWDGQRMIYGDGDKEQFDRFTKCIDVIGHELTHGVTQNEAGLIYWGQPGALNESISDVFGSLVKQYHLNQTAAQADWLIGQGLFMPGVQGKAIRSMKAPGTAYDDPVLGKDPQPAHMDHYETTLQDNGGVHINSGIPNHAFYLAATKLGGYAWETAGWIWYETLLRPDLGKAANFAAFAGLTVATAELLFPSGPAAQAVSDAWNAVGVTYDSSSALRSA